MGLFSSLFKSYSEKQIKKLTPTVDAIEALADKFAAMTDEEMRAYTDVLKGKLAEGKTLDDILPEAFALVREADDRVLGKRPFRVQLMGGILLHQGRVAEMKTGEGKTLVETMPAYLNALTGNGVHIVTVNDYLASRDSQEMGKVYAFLGLSTGLIYSHQPHSEKRAAYAADITYGTNHEYGFDYLRDNMAVYKERLTQRGHAFAIVDEVDSILIDEARTPLIISGEGSKSTDLYGTADVLARSLHPLVVKEMDTKSDNDYREEYFYSEEFSEPTGYLSKLGVFRAMRTFELGEDDFVFDEDGVKASITASAMEKLTCEQGFTEEHFTSLEEDGAIIFSESGMRRVQKLLGVSLFIDDKLGSAYISTIGKNKAMQFFSFDEADFVCTDKRRQMYSFTKSGISRARTEFHLKDSDFLFGEKDFVSSDQARVTVFTKSGAENAIKYFGMSEEDFAVGAKARTAALTAAGAEKFIRALGLEKRDLIEDTKTGTYSISKQADGKVKTIFNLDFATDKSTGRVMLTNKGAQRIKALFSLSDGDFVHKGTLAELTPTAANAIGEASALGEKAFIALDRKGESLSLSSELAARLINLSVLDAKDVVTDAKGRSVSLNASGADKLNNFFSLELSEIKSEKDDDGNAQTRITASGAQKIRNQFTFAEGEAYTVCEDGTAALTEKGHARLAWLLGGEGSGSVAALTKQGALSVLKLLDFDYIVDEKARTAVLTASGIEKAEKFFGVKNLAAEECVELSKHINIAIRAHGIMKRDVDYIVRDDAVVIVDTFTGRLMPGRRYNDGLHQAIEAKEHVKIQKESKTIATITYQNYFRMYKKLSGMTGTALTEENEFRDIYGLDVVEVPTNMPLIRIDHNDALFRTRRAKIAAIVEQIKVCHEKGQPVLVGTVSVDKSEELSLILKKEKIPHSVLNAKQHEKEAEIVANAGTPGAVTISTNMAGRGTDIMLGGNPEHLAKQRLRREGIPEDVITVATGSVGTDDEEILSARSLYRQYYKEYKQQIQPLAEKVKESGGLFIIGTERHESRRIDNQLRGRSGRQGDPGESRFYLSLEDDLLRLFGSDRIAVTAQRLGLPENMPLDMRIVGGTIERAQKRLEASNFARRKHVLTYDDVMNEQRKVIYKQRMEILFEDDISARITDLIKESVSDSFDEYIGTASYEDAKPSAFGEHYGNLLNGGRTLSYTEEEFAALDKEKLKAEFIEKAIALYHSKDDIAKATEGMPDNVMREIEKRILLQNVDTKWMDHLEAMEELKGYVGLNSYAQRDPTVAYRIEGSEMFDSMIKDIREDTVTKLLMGIPTLDGARRTEAAKITGEGASPDGAKRRPTVAKRPNISRNSPCYCGSGKKYKDCCWAKDQRGE